MRVDLGTAQRSLLDAALSLAARPEFGRLIVVCDRPLPDGALGPRSRARGKILYAVTQRARHAELEAARVPSVLIPGYKLTRFERLKLALIAAAAEGVVRTGEMALALVSLRPLGRPDTMNVVRVGAPGEELPVGQGLASFGDHPEVTEAGIDFAVTVGADGWEGHPVGALIVVGDEEQVMDRSRQLVLNPFAGHPEAQRDLRDPQVRESLRPFAILDGAMIVRGDGVAIAAGRYLAPHRAVEVPLGLGARHVAAAAISAETDATAIAVSQTSGTVRVFRGGVLVLELRTARRL